ncbi:hypothetical protein Tco_1255429, partial [Tanacetum coccineum]
LCLDKNLSDHRPILVRELIMDYGPTPFRIYHSWFSKEGFDKLVENSWNKPVLAELNRMDRLKKKFQNLKAAIKLWLKEGNNSNYDNKTAIQKQLSNLDKNIDQGVCNEEILTERTKLKFAPPPTHRLCIESQFDKVMSQEQNNDLERPISKEEIKGAVWDCGTNKSPGAIVLVAIYAWRFLNWVWLKPKKMEKFLRDQGLKGTSYKFLYGDVKDMVKMITEAYKKPINLDNQSKS